MACYVSIDLFSPLSVFFLTLHRLCLARTHARILAHAHTCARARSHAHIHDNGHLKHTKKHEVLFGSKTRLSYFAACFACLVGRGGGGERSDNSGGHVRAKRNLSYQKQSPVEKHVTRHFTFEGDREKMKLNEPEGQKFGRILSIGEVCKAVFWLNQD